MQINTFTLLMIIKMQKINFFTLMLLGLFFMGCSLSPGMNMDTNSGWLSEEYIYVDKNKQKKISIELVNYKLIKELEGIGKKPYQIGKGDKIGVVVWGLPDVFPQASLNVQNATRTVNTDGTMYFPYSGSIQAEKKTQVQLREDLTLELSKYFNEPQLDISVVEFNSQKVYILGEVTAPKILPITETPLSLSDALGEVLGLNTNTSDASEVFIIRQPFNGENERIFRADLSSPAGFLITSEFYLLPYDIVYVNPKGITNWNRVISQFFPFSSFLNSLDNLREN